MRADMPHVLLTADAVGGVWQYATGLAAALAQDGHRVTIAVMGPPPSPAQRAALVDLESVTLVMTGWPLDWMCESAAEVAAAAQAIVRLARECRADLVHCNSPALVGAVPFPLPVLAAAHGCIATWWQAARGGAPVDPSLRWHGELMRRGLIAADAAVAPSASFAATLQATYTLPRLPMVVHNGRPAASDPSAAEAHRLDAVLSVGRMWDPVKNAALLDALAPLIDLPVLAAGSLRGPHGERATFAHVEALGTLPEADLAGLLALRPILASPATFEPFGLAVLEAATSACALVLSDIATFRELWDGAALFADPRDPASFAAAVTRLRTEPGLRDALGEAARARAVRFTPEMTVKGITAIYRTLLARPAEAAA